MWNVSEAVTIPSDSERGPEDVIFRCENCVAVLDGHSNAPGTVNGLTQGQIAVKFGLEALKCFDWTSNVHEIVPHLTEHLRNGFASLRVSGEKRPGFVLVAFFPEWGLILRVGDCQYFVDGKGHNPGLVVDSVKSDIRRAILQRLIRDGQSFEALLANDPTRGLMHDLKVWQHDNRNRKNGPYRYGVIDGTPVPDQLVETFWVPDCAEYVILTSDGYPPQVVKPTFEETEAEFSRLLLRDPLCINEWPAVRGVKPGRGRPDDCSYVRIGRE